MKAANLVERHLNTVKCSVGCPILDRCLGGGVPCSSITELVSESGCGKTQVCLQLLLSAQLPLSHGGLSASSLYIHSEFPFALRQLSQSLRFSHDRNGDPCDRVFVQGVHSADHLLDVLSRLDSLLVNPPSQRPVKLIVIDSIAALFRSEFENSPCDLRRRSSLFFKISGRLKLPATRFELAVLVTNQVADAVETSDYVRIGNLPLLYSSGRRVLPTLGLHGPTVSTRGCSCREMRKQWIVWLMWVMLIHRGNKPGGDFMFFSRHICPILLVNL